MPEDTFNPYQILGVDPGSSDEEIKAAYKKAAQAAHPDRKGGSPERMSEVNQAYQLLSDPDRRAQYDSGASTVPPIPLERRAKDFLLGLAAIVIRTAPLSANMVTLLVNGIGNHKTSLRESRAKTLSELEGLRQRLQRLKGPPENFLEDLIKQEIVKGERLLLIYDADELVMGKSLEILRDFSWEEPVSTYPQILLPGGILRLGY